MQQVDEYPSASLSFWRGAKIRGQMIRRSWGVLGMSWGALGRSWARLGGPLGGLGAVLGGLGALLGASWGGLRRSWDDLGATFRTVQFPIDFWIDFGRQEGPPREAFWDPKWSQNRSQNDSKSKLIFKSEQIPFKTVLGPSWSRLGSILGHLDRA